MFRIDMSCPPRAILPKGTLAPNGGNQSAAMTRAQTILQNRACGIYGVTTGPQGPTGKPGLDGQSGVQGPTGPGGETLIYYSDANNIFLVEQGQTGGTISGSANTAMGYKALTDNTTGANNTAIGARALTDNTTGANNTAIGAGALYNNGASNNTAIGSGALFNNNNIENTAVGTATLFNNNGANNTAIGFSALYTNSNGNNNTSIGHNSLFKNSGNNNIAVGLGTLYNNNASNNTAIGTNALYSNTIGSSNIAIGNGVGSGNNGSNNIFIGSIGEGNVSGNIIIGSSFTTTSTVYSDTVNFKGSTGNALCSIDTPGTATGNLNVSSINFGGTYTTASTTTTQLGCVITTYPSSVFCLNDVDTIVGTWNVPTAGIWAINYCVRLHTLAPVPPPVIHETSITNFKTYLDHSSITNNLMQVDTSTQSADVFVSVPSVIPSQTGSYIGYLDAGNLTLHCFISYLSNLTNQYVKTLDSSQASGQATVIMATRIA